MVGNTLGQAVAGAYIRQGSDTYVIESGIVARGSQYLHLLKIRAFQPLAQLLCVLLTDESPDL